MIIVLLRCLKLGNFMWHKKGCSVYTKLISFHIQCPTEERQNNKKCLALLHLTDSYLWCLDEPVGDAPPRVHWSCSHHSWWCQRLCGPWSSTHHLYRSLCLLKDTSIQGKRQCTWSKEVSRSKQDLWNIVCLWVVYKMDGLSEKKKNQLRIYWCLLRVSASGSLVWLDTTVLWGKW